MDALSISRTGEDGLTDREALLVADITNSGQDTPDFSAAGYLDEEGARLAVRREPVQTAVQTGLEAKIKTTGAAKAIKTILALMDEKNPPATRLAAAKWVAETAGIGPASTGGASGEKPINEMTTAELERFVKKLSQAKDAAMKPAIEHVPPETRA